MKTEVIFLGYRENDERRKSEKPWPHYAWQIVINGERFDYRTGIGHATKISPSWGQWNKRPTNPCVKCETSQAWAHKPEIDDVLECLISDMRCGDGTFHNFCNELGYDEDSRSALELYLACQEDGVKLRRALGKEYQETIDRIEERNA